MKFIEPMGKIVDMPHYVSYGETDAMGVLYYAEYLHICERARNYLGREVGFIYSQMEEIDGLFLPVREAHMRYRSSIRYDNLIYVRLGVSELKKASICFSYQFLDETKTKIMAEGMTLHACINKDFKICTFPQSVQEKFL